MSTSNHVCKRTEAHLAMWHGTMVDMVSVSGYTAGPGLMVHREAHFNLNGLYILKTWGVSHTPSGRKVVGKFRTRAQALKAARAMQRIKEVDWSVPFEGGNDPFTVKTFGFVGLGKRVKAIEVRAKRD